MIFPKGERGKFYQPDAKFHIPIYFEPDLSEKEIDQLVVAQAADDSAWESPIQVQPSDLAALPLQAEVARRAMFLVRLYRKTNMAEWLVHIIQERLDFEEAIYGDVKREWSLTESKNIQ